MKKVLIVDDDIDSLILITQLLKAYAFRVQYLSEPKEIPTVLREYQPDVLVLDIRLFDHDGREICKKLKNDPLTNSIKIILYSAYNDDAEKYKNYDADDFIPKPFALRDLVDKIHFHLKMEA